MSGSNFRIGLAIAFSPRITALLAEANRIRQFSGGDLVLIHVGPHTAHEETLLQQHLEAARIPQDTTVRVCWETGDPAERILSACKKENINLLIAGALRKENLVQYYLGTVARNILRKANCSVLMLTQPQVEPIPFKNIVVNAEDTPLAEDAVASACALGMYDKANWLHVVREIKMYGLTMSTAEHCSEEEYDELRHKLLQEEIEQVEKILQRIPHEGLKVNIKLVSGKSGFELSRFAQRKQADLLVVAAPPRRFSFFDRVFPNDLEYIFADLPCNILMVHPQHSFRHIRKEVARG